MNTDNDPIDNIGDDYARFVHSIAYMKFRITS